MRFPKLISVVSAGKYRLDVRFEDGKCGTIDLSRFAKQGVFGIWENEGVFESVYIDPETKAIAWSDEVDMCPDTFYLELKNITFEDWKQQNDSYAYH